jgi:hypothetical protein
VAEANRVRSPRWTGAMVQSRAIDLVAAALVEANRYPRPDSPGGDAAWKSIVKEITERDALAVVQALYAAGMLREPPDA